MTETDEMALNSSACGSNLCEQLMHRESNMGLQGNPREFVAHLYRERYRRARNLYKTDLRAHYGCVNAIEFSNGGKYLASGGDDKRVLIWDVEKAIASRGRPRVLDTEHTSNIFCLGFDRHNRKVFSGGNDDLVIVHDFETGKLSNVFKHDNPVYGLSIDPQCDSIFATACEDGKILVFDQRLDPADPFVIAQLRTSFHAVEFHPAGGNFLVTANSKRGAAFWDIRKPHHPVIQYGYVEDPPSCMSVRFNSTGSLILALRRRLPPILYNTQSAEPVCTFYHGNYYNSCTMKSCTFAGEDDEFVLSGSDDFNLYVWRVSDVDLERTDQWIETTQMVLYGHRSIVNQVRYNRNKCLLASSGVEKVVKLWSPFEQNGWSGSLLEESTCSDNPRELYSPYNFTSMSTPPHSWSHMSHDYSSRNTSEDPRMMAFFDSLIQQEIEGWETNSSTDSPLGSQGSQTHTSSDESSTDSSLDDDDDNDRGDGGANCTGNAERGRRTKRYVVRKKDRKRRSVLRKVQRHKYANRIAYLIATKRNTLRRLAIKGASLSNRRPYKVVKVGRSNAKSSQRVAASKRHAHRLNSIATGSAAAMSNTTTNGTSNAAIASTSAAAISLNSYRSQRRKYKKNCVYDTTSSDEASETGNPIASSSSSRYNAPTVHNNAAVPSTSTGITTSLKDDIIRLRRQQQNIIDSDEDEDDETVSPTAGLRPRQRRNAEVVVDPTVQPTKKLNGVRRTNDAAVLESSSSSTGTSILTPEVTRRNVSVIHHNQQSQTQSQSQTPMPSQQRVHLRPTISAALNIMSDNSVTTPTPAVQQTTSSRTTTTTTTMLPQSSTNNSKYKTNFNNNNNNNFSNNFTNRRRPHADLIDNYSSHSNSRLSNSSYQDDILDTTSSSSSSSDELVLTNGNGNGNVKSLRKYQQQEAEEHDNDEDADDDYHCHTTPVKRRKLAIAEYISERIEQIDDNATMEENNNNNEQNNNTIYTACHQHGSDGGDEQQRQLHVVASSSSHSHSNSNNAVVPFTPDSGISMTANITPPNHIDSPSADESSSVNTNGITYNDGVASSSTTAGRTYVATRHGGGVGNGGVGVGVENAKGHNNNNNNKTAIHNSIFQQKVARVRRNYRKKFTVDESESD